MGMNVCAKFRGDRLRINKALAKPITTTGTRTSRTAFTDPFGSKNEELLTIFTSKPKHAMRRECNNGYYITSTRQEQTPDLAIILIAALNNNSTVTEIVYT